VQKTDPALFDVSHDNVMKKKFLTFIMHLTKRS
jgi:hypothetical protein